MYLAKVTGIVESSVRLPGFDALKLLVLQPVDFENKPIRWTTIATDLTGAGIGTLVAYVEGREAANPYEPVLAIDACVIAIIDAVNFDGSVGKV